jgi:hypothetical protein
MAKLAAATPQDSTYGLRLAGSYRIEDWACTSTSITVIFPVPPFDSPFGSIGDASGKIVADVTADIGGHGPVVPEQHHQRLKGLV